MDRFNIPKNLHIYNLAIQTAAFQQLPEEAETLLKGPYCELFPLWEHQFTPLMQSWRAVGLRRTAAL